MILPLHPVIGVAKQAASLQNSPFGIRICLGAGFPLPGQLSGGGER